jgi:hypothetical protein
MPRRRGVRCPKRLGEAGLPFGDGVTMCRDVSTPAPGRSGSQRAYPLLVRNRAHLAGVIAFACGCGSQSAVDPSDAGSSSADLPPPRHASPSARVPAFGAVRDVALGGANLCVREANSVRCVGDWPVPFKGTGVRNQGFREPVIVGGLRDVGTLTVAQHRACGIVGGGEIVCWGNTIATETGWTGAVEGRLDAATVLELEEVESLALGHSGSCALDRSGKVTCFGPTFRPLRGAAKGPFPPRVLAEGVKQISAFGFSLCVLRVDGTVHCTGEGATTESGVESLTPVPGLTAAIQIAVGDAHGCALHASGRVSCWGSNARGQLGDGTQLERKGAVPVRDVDDATAVASGHGFSCALTRQGVLCWGDNGNCVTGDEHRGCVKETVRATTGEAVLEVCPLPQRISLPIEPQKIALGSGTGCAVDVAGQVACWGRSLTRAPGGCVGTRL